MRPTTTIHRFTHSELEKMEEQTGIEDKEENLRKWARHNYPIRETGYYNIGEVTVDEDGGEIEIVEL